MRSGTFIRWNIQKLFLKDGAEAGEYRKSGPLRLGGQPEIRCACLVRRYCFEFRSMRNQLSAGLNMGIAGISWWTTDIGGFHGGDPNDESIQRTVCKMVPMGCILPSHEATWRQNTSDKQVYRKDGSKSLFTGGDNEVWSFGEEAYEILVKYMELREKNKTIYPKLNGRST